MSLFGYTNLGMPLGSALEPWLHFVNSANTRARLARFCLDKTAEGNPQLTVSAHVTGVYERHAFGLLMDMWHQDQRFFKDMPPTVTEICESADAGTAGAVVH